MRGKLFIFTLGLLALSAYVASPFVAAWSIREAVRNGNTAYLEQRIDWPSVKTSLKASMTDYALGPQARAAETGGAAPRPGLWQRLKNAAGKRVVASVVDNMATPSGLSRLFTYRKTYNEKVRGLPDERATLGLTERMARMWSRISRAEFLTPARFAMEMRDQSVEGRRYSGILELQAGTWRLVHLEVNGNDRPAAGQQPPNSERNGTRVTAGVWQAMKQAALP